MKQWIDIFAPILVPIDWNTEATTSNEQRYNILESMCNVIPQLDIESVSWPFGYGSSLHDNLPLLYQPSAILKPKEILNHNDISECSIYIYDFTIAIVHITLEIESTLSPSQDKETSDRIDSLLQTSISPLLEKIQSQPVNHPLENTKDYNFFDLGSKDLISAKPLWVSRMAWQHDNRENIKQWLGCDINENANLTISNGNYYLASNIDYECAIRSIILAQFFSASLYLMEETIIKELKRSIALRKAPDINESLMRQQKRLDRFSLMSLLYSSAKSGLQGKRRAFLNIIDNEWSTESNQLRVNELMHLNQSRLNRLKSEVEYKSIRISKMLLVFLASTSLLSLAVDIRGFMKTEDHSETKGIFDILALAPSEILITTLFLVTLFLTYFLSDKNAQ